MHRSRIVLGILLLEEDVIITVSLVILSLVILSLFASYEYGLTKGEKTPLIDINMLKVRNLSVGTLIRLITSLAMWLSPLLLQLTSFT